MFKRLILFFLGDFSPFVFSIITFIILLSKMNSLEYGRYVFFTSLFSLSISLINFGMNYTGVNILLENINSQRTVVKKILQLRIYMLIGISFIFLLCVIFKILNLNEFFLLFGLCFLQVFQLDFVNIALETPILNLIARLIQSIVFLSMIFIYVDKSTNSTLILFFQVISLLFSNSYYYFYCYRKLNSIEKKLDISPSKIFFLGYKITIAQFLQSGYLNSDIIILTSISRDQILIGQYGAAIKLLSSGLIPMGSILNTFSSGLVNSFNLRDVQSIKKKVNQLLRISLSIGIIGFIAIIFLGNFVLVFLSKKEMPVAKEIMPILGAIYLVYAIQLPFAATLPYFKLYDEFIKISLVILLFSIIISTISYLLFGYKFMPLGSFIAASALAIFSYRIYQRFINDLNEKEIMKAV
jgi:O-antigen/teichoic acid export membrane protein